jgi:rRNA maturation protein Nop10
MLKVYALGINMVPQGSSGEICNSVYDLTNACPNCGIKAKIIGNLRVKEISKIKKEILITRSFDYLISFRVYDELIKAGVKIGKLAGVESTRGEHLPYYHLKPESFLPKFGNKTKGYTIDIKEQCPVCFQNCYFNLPKEDFLEYYDELPISLLEQSDLFNTWEHWGYSRLKPIGYYYVRFARPHIIVTENLKEVIESLGLKYVIFTPIEVVKFV